MMEKRNVVEERRTPCRKSSGVFCDCPSCKAQSLQKKGSTVEKPVSINDIEAMAEVHK